MKVIGLIHKDSHTDYGVCFPDFPGCVSVGSTLEEAKKMGEEALRDHVEILREMGETIPNPRMLEEVTELEDAQDAGLFVVTIPDAQKVRVNISMPKDVLVLIDQKAGQAHLSRSAYIIQTLKKS